MQSIAALDIDGRLVRGSDPEWKRLGDRYVGHHTWGPTDPTRPGGSSPGIYQRESESGPVRPFSRAELVIAPDHDAGEAGVETFTCEWHPRGYWIGCAHVYGPGPRGVRNTDRLRFYFARDLLGSWAPIEVHGKPLELWPEFPWENMVSEPALAWFDAFGVMVLTYSNRTAAPRTQWQTSYAVSADLIHWHRAPFPFAVPPQVFEDRQGINAYSHSEVTDIGDELLCITTESGSVSPDKKGLSRWRWDRGFWALEESLFLTAADEEMTHVGGPSVFYAHDGMLLAIHADRDRGPDPIRRHVRILPFAEGEKPGAPD